MVVCSVCWQEHNPLFPQRKFHSFPSNAEKREEWFKSIGRVIETYKTARICSDHFTEDDYYDTGTIVQPRRLKNTAIPSIFTQKSCKRKSKKDVSVVDIQDESQHDSTIEIQSDDQLNSVLNIQYDSATEVQHDDQCNSIIEIPCDSIIIVQRDDDQLDLTIDAQYDDNEQDSTIEVQHNSTIEVQQDSSIETQHNKHENGHDSIMDIQNDSEHGSIIDDQHDSEHDSMIDFQEDNNVSTEPLLVTKNGKPQKRKRSDISYLDKVFVKTGEHQRECLRKTDFVNVQAWTTFLKFLTYTRRLKKRSQEQNTHLQHKIVSAQIMAEKLKTHYAKTMHQANEKNTFQDQL
ncbi:uncharacterized protein LOC109861828 [Pseudomyrmex gracilis]|uniref:uncharacterized protein LOC109861828 n=1 Tax=Pseudomyrmex gracilis TaxID=219809 RepID=UPI000995A718|nr:uncharacterized protein LOC109861828 [Pseudomyrmex gracilis]